MPTDTEVVVFTAPGRVEVRPARIPDPGPNDVLIRTAYSGVSQGTERWLLLGRYNPIGQDATTRYPCFPGYQAAGIVEAVGDDVPDLRPGDRVIASGTRLLDAIPVSPGRAAHCGYLVTPRQDVARLGNDADLAVAALFVLAAVGRHGARLVDVRGGELVVVIGQGMIGQLAAQAARARGARVIATDLIDQRVGLSARHSADRAVALSGQALVDLVHAEALEGADVVVDTTGNARMFDTCLELIRREGRICLQGYYPDPLVIDFHAAHLQRATVVFPCGWDRERDQELADDLSRGRPTIAPLITHRVSYRQAPDAYRLVVDHPEESLGMVLKWSEG